MVALEMKAEDWELTRPIRIAGHVFTSTQVVVATLRDGELSGRGEASGVYYHGDTADRILEQIERVRSHIESGIDIARLHELLGPGGARNAIDCALWDLQAKRQGQPVYEIIGLSPPKPLLTCITLSAEDPPALSDRCREVSHYKAIKLKLTGDSLDADRIRTVRQIRPDAWLSVDANQGLSLDSFADLQPVFLECQVALIEQPLPVGQEYQMDRITSPIPIAADESAQCVADLSELVGRFQVITVKLDKAGGLTEALSMVRAARELGMRVMLGCTRCTSLGIAPGYLVGQLCDYVDLDAPLSLRSDRRPSASYAHGYVAVPRDVWGYPTQGEAPSQGSVLVASPR